MNYTDILNFEYDFSKYMEAFLERNSVLNLISKNEEKFLYEKHIYDSLSIKLFFDKYNIVSGNLLDIGSGGGFPALPIALVYPKISVTALDSIQKKINAILAIKQELNITNLDVICDRAENLKEEKYDIITSRAVAPIEVLVKYAAPLLEPEGYFVAYKSKRSVEEIHDAELVLKKHKLKCIDMINYTLPLDEVYERKLLIFKRFI
ncbi:MAG: 16S rRNA (guanine(527)-N(7))-methyltransferase RsmG [Candidatus Gastranaerophilaceae bacterium]